MFRTTRHALGFSLFLIALFTSTPSLFAQKVKITRDLPPAIDLANKRIGLEITSTSGIPTSRLNTFKARLETALQSDKRFVIDQANPATLVRITATDSKVARNSLDMPIKGQQVKVDHVVGTLQVSFQAVDGVTKQPLDSQNLQAVVERNYFTLPVRRGFGGVLGGALNLIPAPTMNEDQIFNALVENIMGQITRRIAQTSETIDVGEPGEPLKKFRPKAANKEWVSLYDDLDEFKPKDDDKAEREYWLGVSKEAEAYETKDRAQARQSLVVASRHYGEAFKLKPDAFNYADSQHRAEESTILLAGANPNGATGVTSNTSRAVGPAGATAGGEEILTNDSIILAFSNKLPADLVLGLIKDAKKTQFDVTIVGLSRLSQAGVPANVLEAIREKAKSQ
jgi:hypothetical protein